ncbi:MAG: sensor domain-containing diguanylate cyclase [Cellvibrionaceae bacterium]
MKNEQDYQRLSQTVTNLLVRIEENQQIQARFHDYEFQLLGCRKLSELLDRLFEGAKEHFDLAAVSLVLYDPDYSLAGLMEHLDLGDFNNCFQLRHTEDFFEQLYEGVPSVRLGELDVLKSTRLFPNVDKIGSAALLPLMRQQRQIGSLHFASHSSKRYSADKAVSFMWHLALMVAVCLENCVALEQLKRQGQEDILTQVRNRRSFEEELIKELERAKRQSAQLSCMFVDIDHFKNINDTYGHQTGDLCLRQVALHINEELRKTDLLARYGGEEFVALLPNCESKQAEIIADRVRETIAKYPLITTDKKEIPITVSIGLTTWIPNDKNSSDLIAVGKELLGAADSAMYIAKKEGRNKIKISPFNDSVLSQESQLESESANTSL